MKLRDIPQFIECNGYRVFTSLKFFKQTIEDYINEQGLIMNPDFQRGHVWTEEQQIRFVEYVLRGGKSGLDLYFNCPRWLSASGKQGEFVNVDGLQRTTALLRFLNNEIKAFGHYLNEFEDKLDRTIGMWININQLETRKEVIQWFLEMNYAGTPHTEENLNRVRELLKQCS